MSSGPDQWKRPWWLAFLDRTNLTVTALTAICILYTRSAGAAYFATGALACSMTVKVIKRAIRQPRPKHPSQRKLSYGMPSTHSATIMFYATYIPLACANLPLHPRLPQSSSIRLLAPLIVVPWSTLIAVSRVWLGHHTWAQVAAGSLYGVAFAAAWFSLWTRGVNEHGWALEQAVNEYLGWK
ncbi:hypothetical protein HGRIS_013077 [Hohenbuehelia grisea]|uniref:Phosphatidic acid phosphatase type 2/haloperoxidase domain-containing protein n=1 Tax=Hohenbuehelia grisea TaxID=104357 RepID=A0ABR3IUK6_9AGAR